MPPRPHSTSAASSRAHIEPQPHNEAEYSSTNTHHSRAPALPEVEHSDDSVSSLVDVDSPHISSVPSDYESQSIKTDTQADREEREEEIKREAKDLKEKAAAKKEQAKDKAEQAKNVAAKNSDNPVVLSNAVGLAVVAGVLGIGAYRKYVHGELTGKLVAAWVGVIGLFGVGDFYVSQ
jgi:F0F1-type ATP synthase assembly protein I